MISNKNMSGISEKLAAFKAAQEVADKKKESEAAKAEKEAEKSALSVERGAVMAKLAETEVEVAEVEKALQEVDAVAAEKGADLTPEARAIGDAIKAEAVEVKQKFDSLKAELAKIDSELAAFGVEGAVAAEKVEAPQEAAGEAAPAETPKEAVAESVPEAPAEAAAEPTPEISQEEALAEEARSQAESDKRHRENVQVQQSKLEEISRLSGDKRRKFIRKIAEESVDHTNKFTDLQWAMHENTQVQNNPEEILKIREEMGKYKDEKWQSQHRADLDSLEGKQGSSLDAAAENIGRNILVLKEILNLDLSMIAEKKKDAERIGKKMLSDFAERALEYLRSSPEQVFYSPEVRRAVEFLTDTDFKEFGDLPKAKELLDEYEKIVKGTQEAFGTYDKRTKMFGEKYEGERLSQEGLTEARQRARDYIREKREVFKKRSELT